MGVKSKGAIPSRRMSEQVELFRVTKEDDGIGGNEDVSESVGVYDAEVTEMSGGRLSYYLQLGFSHPLIISMWKPDAEFQAVKWKGKELKISSINPDPENWDRIRIVADYIDGEI